MTKEEPRPGQATLAGALIIGGSVILVLAAWQRIATLRTLEVQESFEKVVRDPMLSELGWTADDFSMLVRVLCIVGAAAATAAAILGVQVYKRSTSARIALTALTPFLFLGGLVSDGFLTPMVLVGIALLWLQPTRDWYAGRPWVKRYEERRAARLAALRPPASALPGQPPASAPAPTAPGQPPAPAAGAPRPLTGPAPVPPRRPGQRRRTAAERGPRPPALRLACVLTWASSALAVVGLGFGATFASRLGEEIFAQMTREQPKMLEAYQLTESELVATLYLLFVGGALWAVGATVLAGLAYLGHNWARIVLAVSGAAAAAVALFFTLALWPLVVLVGMLGAATWLLTRPEVGRWFLP
ncbi:hypothetical protein F9L07_11460 [Pimelobacter simplex]|uniref:DUF4064 domain-containing protein n=1 Tax=Nocardioides simplex TaxID=2045 RepID=A0A7J5E299_NOCSI|nr:hypothetical protein [Pimelobacter simplex]KAB2812385.1 hypothetical protein F9L07_11460 [Pimelobacter simplex]